MGKIVLVNVVLAVLLTGCFQHEGPPSVYAMPHPIKCQHNETDDSFIFDREGVKSWTRYPVSPAQIVVVDREGRIRKIVTNGDWVCVEWGVHDE